jgi:hypothetical protein
VDFVPIAARYVPRSRLDPAVVNGGENALARSFLPPRLVDDVGRLAPEKRLMLAVLEAAVSDFQKYATASTGRGRRLFADADAWLESAAADQPLDFENICDALGFDASFIRKGLRRWRAARLREPTPSRAMLRFPFRRINRATRATSGTPRAAGGVAGRHGSREKASLRRVPGTKGQAASDERRLGSMALAMRVTAGDRRTMSGRCIPCRRAPRRAAIRSGAESRLPGR